MADNKKPPKWGQLLLILLVQLCSRGVNATMGNDQLSIYLPSIFWQVSRPVRLTNARRKPKPLKLGKLPVNRAAGATMPVCRERPMS